MENGKTKVAMDIAFFHLISTHTERTLNLSMNGSLAVAGNSLSLNTYMDNILCVC